MTTPSLNTLPDSAVERLVRRIHSTAVRADLPLTRRAAAWLLDTLAHLRRQAQLSRLFAELEHHVDEADYYSTLGDQARHAHAWHERQAQLLRQRLASFPTTTTTPR